MYPRERRISHIPFNGSGTFSRVYNWVTDKNNSINITASRMDTEDTGFATGLSLCLTKDGQQNPTANLPMNGFAHTGVANATLANQYAVVGQVQSSSYSWIAAGGTADAITATYAPALTSLTNGLVLKFRATAANATTTPTFAPNGLTAHTITKQGGAALLAGDITAALAEYEVVYNLANTRWELMNPDVNAGTSANQLVRLNGSAQLPAVSGALLTNLPNNSKVTLYQVTDATDIALSAVPTQANVGGTLSITIPTKGTIELAPSVEMVSSGGSYLILGIRIGSTNYWPTLTDGGSATYEASGFATGADTTNASAAYASHFSQTNGAGAGGVWVMGLNIEILSIPTGAQTVQIIAAKSSNGITLKGTVVTSRINIRVFDHS